jgi:hypothetical protein
MYTVYSKECSGTGEGRMGVSYHITLLFKCGIFFLFPQRGNVHTLKKTEKFLIDTETFLIELHPRSL